MSKKIALLNPHPDRKLFRKQAVGNLYMDAHLEVLESHKGADTELMMYDLAPGVLKGQQSVVDYFMNALIVPTFCKGAMDAEAEGADAAILVCTDDPGLRQCRTLVDMPVVGEFESMIHLASMMGHKFGAITWPTRPFMARTELKIQTYGLKDKAIERPAEPVVEPGPNAERIVVTEGLQDPKAFVEKYYVPAAQRLIERGAEVIVIDSTGLSLVACMAGLKEITDVGISTKPENPTVPVVDAVTASLKVAEMMVELRRLGLNPVSRIGLYQKAQDIVPPRDFQLMRDGYEKDWQQHEAVLQGLIR